MPETNTIELYNKADDTITTLRLYRIMAVGHLDEPNAAAKYKAVLRACQPLASRRDPTRKTTFEQQEAIIPDGMKEAMFNAFNNDSFVLAQIEEACITALSIVSEPLRFDVEKYKDDYGHPIKAIDGRS